MRNYNSDLTVLTGWVTVRPRKSNHWPAGADTPKRSMPTTAPSRPTYSVLIREPSRERNDRDPARGAAGWWRRWRRWRGVADIGHLIGMPGWPELACWTVPMARARTTRVRGGNAVGTIFRWFGAGSSVAWTNYPPKWKALPLSVTKHGRVSGRDSFSSPASVQ
ncbi:hypothetical protein ACCUM_1151 [Candidatus Accumulibacter phosphatis]|uniref:Uncharacterized protein n=1 Tax=Candidatus Accumulibacter phosphatis TaxID=327160 RepID=A0A5S4ESY6_9PROT|nr:hypothetical protein ACCUM_1151 [Candidatus Accumulibacter phosphatis]